MYRALLDQIAQKIVLPAFPLILNNICGHIESGDWFYRTREAVFGVSMDAVMPKNDTDAAAMGEAMGKGLDELAQAMDADGEGNCRLTGGKVTYAEMEFVAILYFVKLAGRESAWKHIKDRNGGRWEKLLETYSSRLPVQTLV